MPETEIIEFDYSTSDGNLTLRGGVLVFDMQFCKAEGESIHLYRSGSTKRIARVTGSVWDQRVDIDELDSSSRTYNIKVGDGFIVENSRGDLLAGHIISVEDESRGDPADLVRFSCRMFRRGEPLIMP